MKRRTAVHDGQVDVAQCDHGAIALEVLSLDGMGGHGVEQRPDHGGLHRDIDELCLPGLQTAPVCHERGHSTFRAACNQTWGMEMRIGGRSASPVSAIMPPIAANVRWEGYPA